jgi:hypothetical protein
VLAGSEAFTRDFGGLDILSTMILFVNHEWKKSPLLQTGVLRSMLRSVSFVLPRAL